MTHQYFSHKYVNPLERQLHELLELNIKTLQSFSYVNPTDLLTTVKPEEVLEKHMTVFVQNGRKTMNYMRSVFNLMEKNWLNLSDEVTQNTKELMSQAQIVTQKSMKEAMSEGQRTVKKASSTMKRVAKKNVKQAESTRKTIKKAAKTMKQATKAATTAPKKAAKSTLSKTTKSTVSKTKPKTTARSTMAKKPEVRPMATAAAQKTNTINKMESKIHETRQINPLTVPVVKNDAAKKDRHLM